MLKRLTRPIGEKQSAQQQITNDPRAIPKPNVVRQNHEIILKMFEERAVKKAKEKLELERKRAEEAEQRRLIEEQTQAAIKKMWADYADRKKG